jgi:hypothetical protein
MISGSRPPRTPFQQFFEMISPPGSSKRSYQPRQRAFGGGPSPVSYQAAKEYEQIVGEKFKGETLAPTKDDLTKEKFALEEKEAIERERVAKEKLAETQTRIEERKRMRSRRAAAQKRATLFQMSGARYRV